MSDPADRTLAGTGPAPRRALPPHDPGMTQPSPAGGHDGERGPRGTPERLAEPAPPVPRMLGNRYLLEERIASGGMASVWRAHDEVLARTVAVKLLHDHLAADEAFRERFRREAIAAAKLTHPNVVGLYDTGTDGDRVYLVMEFVDGATLRDVIADLGTLEIGQAAAIGEKVARALDYAHERRLVHRDVKPANILLGGDGAVKVADFGIAKAEEDGADLTRTGMVLGTAAYVAPEQIRAQPLTGKADQYGLGCVLYEALTGRRPFKGDSPVATAALRLDHDPLPLRSLRADVPRGLDQIVLRALARDPEDRFPSSGHLADALAAFADADPGETAALVGAAGATITVMRRPDDDASPGGGTPGPPPPDESFLRSEGRWLAPVLALLLLAGALVGVGLATGVLESGEGLLPRFAQDVTPASEEDDPTAAPATAAPLQAAGASTFDPEGGDGENDDQVGAVIDGDPGTQWRTELYNTAAFGNLKDGVGFYVDLGAVRDITAAEVTTTTPGIDYDLRVADAPAAAAADWRVVATVEAAGEQVTTTFDTPVRARYLLVWVTGDLQPTDGRYRAAFSGVTALGTQVANAPPASSRRFLSDSGTAGG